MLAEADEHNQRLLDRACANAELVRVLRAMPGLGVKDCWLVSGCIVQSAWNDMCGNAPDHGIVDYDLIYFDPDTSWEAEDRVIRRGTALFQDLGVPVQIRNQARVHLWYEEKYGRRVPPLRTSCQSLWRYPSRTTAVAVSADEGGNVRLYAPFGVKHALNMTVQPNRRARLPAIYREKAQRWSRAWPELKVVPW